MKHTLYFSLAAAIFLLPSCGGLHRVQPGTFPVTTSPKLSLAVDQETDPYTVPVSFTLTIPAGSVPSCARLVITPRFTAPGNAYALAPVIVQGEKYDQLEQRLSLLEGIPLDYPGVTRHVVRDRDLQVPVDERAAFQPWMPSSRLVLDYRLEACGRGVAPAFHVLADGVFYMPRDPGPVLVKYVKRTVSRVEEGFARFYYLVNRYQVDPALDDNRAQLDEMTGLIRDILSDTLKRVDRVVITGICSPDGSWAYNETLAKERANFIKNYVTTTLRIDPRMVFTRYIAEDWVKLAELVEESDIPGKARVLEVIARVGDDDRREAALRALPEFPRVKQLYPLLRKVTYEIFYTVEESEEVAVPG